MNQATENECFNCGDVCGDDDYCYGCECWICESCCINFDVSGLGHAPEAHIEEPREEGDE